MTRVNDSLEANLDLFSEESEDLADILMGMSHALPFDPEGRIALPRNCSITRASPTRRAFVGKGSRVQIWEPNAFAERSRAALGARRPMARPLRLGRGQAQAERGGRSMTEARPSDIRFSHKPVLLAEVLAAIRPADGGVYD